MKIAVSGLDRMGSQIAHKLIEGGNSVVAHDRSSEPVNAMVKLGASPAYSREDLVASFTEDRIIIWLMVPAEVVDTELTEWFRLLPPGSIIIDGGNSDFRKTEERAKLAAVKGLSLLDVGTSGGIWGYKNGFSMMVGGDNESFKIIEPFLKILAEPEGDYKFFNGSGAGHYVKMVHNAIEYGMMESLAEGYHLLNDGVYKNLDLSAAAEVWQHHSVVTSWLNELALDTLKANPKLEGIDGYVAESGEARWALETAKQNKIDMPSIQAAFDVRLKSQTGEINFATKLLAAIRNAFGGHNLNK